MYTVTHRLNVRPLRSFYERPLQPDSNSASNHSESLHRICNNVIAQLHSLVGRFFSRLRKILMMVLEKLKELIGIPDERDPLQRNITLNPVTFHEKHGKNIRLWINRQIAIRSYDFSDGYVFMKEPIGGRRFFLVVHVLETDPNYLGSIAFGMTTHDPNSITMDLLPPDSKHLHDDRSFLVHSSVTKISTPGDVLIFYSNDADEIRVKVNNNLEETLFHVQKCTPYWCFFDLYGSARKIRAYLAEESEINMLGLLVQQPELLEDHDGLKTVMEESVRENDSATPITARCSFKPSLTLTCRKTRRKILYEPLTTNLPGRDWIEDPSIGYCIECFQNPFNDCLLYPCGDFILCYNCAMKLRRGRCPKCNLTIENVTRIFRP